MTHKIPKNRILLLPKINSEAKKISQVINTTDSDSQIFLLWFLKEERMGASWVGRKR